MFKLLGGLKKYKVPISVIIILTFIEVIAELYLPTIMANIVDKGIVKADTAYIWQSGIQMMGLTIATIILMIIIVFYSAKVSMSYGRDLRAQIFERVTSFSLQEFNKVGTASLITRTSNDVVQMQTLTMMILRMMLTAPIMLIGSIVMAVSRNAKLSLVFCVVLPILMLVMIFIGMKVTPIFKKLQTKTDGLNRVIREGLNGIRVIRAFNKSADERQRFDEVNQGYSETAIYANKVMAFAMPVIMLIMNITSIAIVWFGGKLIGQGELEVGNLMAFIQYGMQVLFSFMMLAMMFVLIPRAAASAQRINDVLALKTEIVDPVKPQVLDNIQHIAFNKVSFQFEHAEKPAIEQVSFTADRGEQIAIIGSTGAGKSTVINMLTRFYEVTTGEVLMNGEDIRQVAQADLRKRIGLVPQKALLFSGTIASNLRYGNGEATDAQLWRALEIAQAAEFVRELDNQLEAVVEQGGDNFSGGQKQRLAIARALVKQADLYIFDDSFSALDFKTDAKLRQALAVYEQDSIMITIAQRITSVMDATKILVMDEGQLVGIGTHETLKATNKVYQEIMRSQLSEEEWA
ncbi:ABC transporter ATP-binding protein [Brochothrix campestris]|uniref:Putative ABC transporter ATP-binding protein n=1 Tax=Brochothrix campestris FSL F6-1037 TaxID=1265861 RepID=W7CS79_9LIST|nr:ABC transporter ATP-binding protein [Brochothrix campestris]EUJ38626.1 putative ABC transporter ATP-binding protein [Brochothrix campestris FSL F6-1037]